jgi:hypothetical protein
MELIQFQQAHARTEKNIPTLLTITYHTTSLASFEPGIIATALSMFFAESNNWKNMVLPL